MVFLRVCSTFLFLVPFLFLFSYEKQKKLERERRRSVAAVRSAAGRTLLLFFFKVTPSQNARSSTRRTPAVPSAHNGARDSVMHGSSKIKVKSRGLSGCNKASLLLETLVHLRAFDVLSLSLLNLKKKERSKNDLVVCPLPVCFLY